MARSKGNYFEPVPGAPVPLSVTVRRHVSFSEVDAMGIVWFGRYAGFCEAAAEELGRQCGLSYRDFFAANLRAPIVQYHVDYLTQLHLQEEIAITASLMWTEAARLNTQFAIRSQAGALAARACTVQLLLDGTTGELCIATPALLEQCRRRWRAGEFGDLQ